MAVNAAADGGSCIICRNHFDDYFDWNGSIKLAFRQTEQKIRYGTGNSGKRIYDSGGAFWFFCCPGNFGCFVYLQFHMALARVP